MPRAHPWITVFEQRSNKVNAANFGLSCVDSGPGGGATLKTAYFSVQGSQVLTQILSFKFESSDAILKSARCQMNLSPETITISEGALQLKVGPFIVNNIKNINI
jgi:hypothetical protein